MAAPQNLSNGLPNGHVNPYPSPSAQARGPRMDSLLWEVPIASGSITRLINRIPRFQDELWYVRRIVVTEKEEHQRHRWRTNRILTTLLVEREEKEDDGCGCFRWVDDDAPFIWEKKFNLLYRLHKAEESLGEVRSLLSKAKASRD
ncbi:hypothetical protein K7X08_020164 [Anisodus acutangulus]|uniref:Uncharacterized protein n=1 Tax=Anisodus acutangulus TaxID=402998 RepID=A0A9Q1RC19_9SOLA|nr:hypothetical protein K7X08_020164 [Anisodus acutangulus]